MMRRIRGSLLWLLDVIVAVFIGSVNNAEHSRKIQKLTAKRGWYTLAFFCFIVLIAAVYKTLSA